MTEQTTEAREALYLQAGNPYFHVNNIVVGQARVFWETGYGRQPSGWWLPGSVHTTSRAEAEAYAKVMDRIMRAAALPAA